MDTREASRQAYSALSIDEKEDCCPHSFNLGWQAREALAQKPREDGGGQSIVHDAPIVRALWPDPSAEMLETPEFKAVWECIKSWDINVPDVYVGYMDATGSHVNAILRALRPSQPITASAQGDAGGAEAHILAMEEALELLQRWLDADLVNGSQLEADTEAAIASLTKALGR